jgi:hypothetical protein
MATVREIAQALVDTFPGMYYKGSCCPLCGYDGLWISGSEEETVDHVVKEIERALQGEDRED